MVEALEFHAQEQKNRLNRQIVGEELRKEQVDLLLSLALNRMKKNPQVLMSACPTKGKRFQVKLPYLLSADQKRVYYNEVVEIMLSQAEGKQVKDVNPYALIRHLKDSIETEYVSPKLIAKLIQKTA